MFVVVQIVKILYYHSLFNPSMGYTLQKSYQTLKSLSTFLQLEHNVIYIFGAIEQKWNIPSFKGRQVVLNKE